MSSPAQYNFTANIFLDKLAVHNAPANQQVGGLLLIDILKQTCLNEKAIPKNGNIYRKSQKAQAFYAK